MRVYPWVLTLLSLLNKACIGIASFILTVLVTVTDIREGTEWYLTIVRELPGQSSLLFFVSASILTSNLRPWLEGKSINLTMAKWVINNAQQSMYGQHSNFAKNRVTVFEYIEYSKIRRLEVLGWKVWDFKHGYAGYLKPILRSNGAQISKHSSRFRVRATGDGSEGIAGMVYDSGAQQVVQHLPLVTKDSHDNRSIYPQLTNCPRHMVETMLSREDGASSLPRSIGGLPIRDANEIVWGVVIFDSEDEAAVPVHLRTKFRYVQDTLTALVRREL